MTWFLKFFKKTGRPCIIQNLKCLRGYIYIPIYILQYIDTDVLFETLQTKTIDII